MSYLRITKPTTTLTAHDPYDLQKEIVAIPNRTNDFAFALFNHRQLQKIQVSNEFPHTNRKKGVKLKFLRCRHSSQTRESTSEELQLNLVGRPDLRYLAYDTVRPQPPCSSSTKS